VTFTFRPAASITERHGLFVALVAPTNAGKTYSGLRLARGIAGAKGKVAVVDTEGGRTLHLRDRFDFDVMMMDPPHRPDRYAEAARAAEQAGYDALLIDSFSSEWAGIGGVLSWHDEEQDAAVARAQAKNDRRSEYQIREASKMASWIKPKVAHKAMVASLIQRRMPIIFSIRGEESVKPGGPGEKPTKLFKAICGADFLFEVTVSFRLAAERKGVIDLSDPQSWKMEGAHRDIFRDGDQLSEDHGAALRAWANGGAAPRPVKAPPSAKALASARERVTALVAALHAAADGAAVQSILSDAATQTARDWLGENAPELGDELETAIEAACIRAAP
jgi:hypothetical protein